MKKVLSFLGLMILSVFVFAGCGIVGATEPTTIKFVQDVFYVDPGIEAKLEYKVYPSTASYNNVILTPISDAQNTNFYFNNGVITVQAGFNPITVTVQLGELSDSCEVRLREYPSAVGFYDVDGEGNMTAKTQDIIQSGLVYSLGLKINQNGAWKTPNNGECIFKVTSSNPSIIAVENEQRLLVRSTGRRGSSQITVAVCDSSGKEKPNLSAKITLIVEQSISSAFATLGDDIVIQNDEVISLRQEQNWQVPLNVDYFDENGFMLDNNEYTVFLSNDSTLELVEEDGKKYLKLLQSGEVIVTLQSRYLNAQGLPLKIVFKIQVQILN